MKFPVLFRIFAVLNLLVFFVIGAGTLFMTTVPDQSGLMMLWSHWAITIWLFVTAIVWFFASKASYHFLYSLSTMLGVVCVCWIWFIWLNPISANSASSDKIIISAIPGLIFLYVVFLIIALFYKPVASWTEKRFSIKHTMIAVALFLCTGLSLYAFGEIHKKSLEIYATKTFPDAETDPEAAWTSIYGDESVKLSFDQIEKVNGISIDLTGDSETMEPFSLARLSYSETKKLDPNTAPNLVIEFKKEGDKLVAEFPEIKVGKILLFPLNSKKEVPSEKVEYNVKGLSALWITSPFEKHDISQSWVVEETEEEYEEGNGRKLVPENTHLFFETFLKDTYFSEEWHFDYNENEMIIGDAKRIGLFKQGFPYLYGDFQETVKKFQGFENYNYEAYFSELTGMDIYASKAKDYQGENNGTAFNQVNPMVITWAENLIPEPDAQILGYTASAYYHDCFQRMARITALSYLHLVNNDFEGEVEYYRNSASITDFYGPQYLSERYEDVQLDYYSVEDGWAGSADFIGFWLRRKIDGTDKKCWETLRKVLVKYDSEWLESAEAGPEEATVEVDSASVQ